MLADDFSSSQVTVKKTVLLEKLRANRVEKLAAGPYVELFGRRLRRGWTVLGDQVPKEGA